MLVLRRTTLQIIVDFSSQKTLLRRRKKIKHIFIYYTRVHTREADDFKPRVTHISEFQCHARSILIWMLLEKKIILSISRQGILQMLYKSKI